MKKILVTGAFGFLGSHIVKHYKNLGYYVVGIGRLREEEHEVMSIADAYLTDEISIEKLRSLGTGFEAIIHCAGGSSVGKSMQNPTKDLLNTTLCTEMVLEYIRLYSKDTRMIYISSAAVYGDKYSTTIEESSLLSPMSFYGVHKKLSEELCKFYTNRFNLKVSVVRFFSIYGAGLEKQLLWDACNKISSDVNSLMFFGSGKELRDWIEVTDALAYIDIALSSDENFLVLNAGTAKEVNVATVLEILIKLFNSKKRITFNGETKIGDPDYLCANIDYGLSLGWKQKIQIEEGLKKYVEWFNSER